MRDRFGLSGVIAIAVTGLMVLGLAAIVGSMVVSAYRATKPTPRDRVVAIETTACGHSSATSGVGVAIGEDRVLTAAHTVSGAGEVVVVPQRGKDTVGTVVAYDQRSDLAVLAVEGLVIGSDFDIPLSLTDVELGVVEAGDDVVVHGTAGGSLAATVTKRAEIRIEGVRSSERGSRFGFLLDVPVELGDSGAPVFDTDDRLVGIVFGRSGDREGRTFAVRAEEIEALLAEPEREWACDPNEHELVAGDK